MNAPSFSDDLHPMPGGIHPPQHKERSLREPLSAAPAPERVTLPLTQPRLGRLDLLVTQGERVRRGQPLARGRDPLGITVHASIAGRVRAIGERPVPNASGIPEPCVEIEALGEDHTVEFPAPADFRSRSPADLLEAIRDAGISGLGGAGFPAHSKLGSGAGGIHTLIINACECEPFITADDMLMRERPADIVAGIRVLLHILGARRCLIGIEDNKPRALAALAAALEAAGDERIALKVVPAIYPSGSERQLIWILTGRAMPHGKLPAESGMVCQNVGTAQAVARAVIHGEPLISRVTTLSGAALARPGNMEVPIGTSIAALLENRGLDPSRLSRLIMGGSLMGITLPGADLPLIKTTNCLIATTEEELPTPPPARACIRCGLCADACPVSLLPQQLYWFARGREHDKAVEHDLFDCIECGACAYVCPSDIPLVQYYRAAKGEIREEREKHARAEHSRRRFEFHQARKEREKAREEERRRERAELARQKAANKAGAKDAIQAALARVQRKKQSRGRENGPVDKERDGGAR